MTVFDVVAALSFTKKDPLRGTPNDELARKDYKPFLINRTFSYHPDAIFNANEMNMHPDLDLELQNDFYINILSKRKRYAKWIKPETSENLEMVMEYFGYGRTKALEALTVLTVDDITMIHDKMYRGGVSNAKRKNNKRPRGDNT